MSRREGACFLTFRVGQKSYMKLLRGRRTGFYIRSGGWEHVSYVASRYTGLRVSGGARNLNIYYVCICACVSTHISRFTHCNHKRKMIPTGS